MVVAESFASPPRPQGSQIPHTSTPFCEVLFWVLKLLLCCLELAHLNLASLSLPVRMRGTELHNGTELPTISGWPCYARRGIAVV